MFAPQVFRKELPERVKYLALGVLFVNVTIGGTPSAVASAMLLLL
ncbi:MAG TPA: putative Na+/H+ antiporter [Burkholderiaceae bacterium]|nr:putative Na+/H+ antiporter [Burkholderiaceae bacterium]